MALINGNNIISVYADGEQIGTNAVKVPIINLLYDIPKQLKEKYRENTINGVTMTFEGDKIILNGTASDLAGWVISDYEYQIPKLTRGKSYNLSGLVGGGHMEYFIRVNFSNSTSIECYDIGGTTFVCENEYPLNFSFFVRSGITVDNLVITPRLEVVK